MGDVGEEECNKLDEQMWGSDEEDNDKQKVSCIIAILLCYNWLI